MCADPQFTDQDLQGRRQELALLAPTAGPVATPAPHRKPDDSHDGDQQQCRARSGGEPGRAQQGEASNQPAATHRPAGVRGQPMPRRTRRDETGNREQQRGKLNRGHPPRRPSTSRWNAAAPSWASPRLLCHTVIA